MIAEVGTLPTEYLNFRKESKAMLVLSRKKGERIQIGDTISVTVLDVRGGKVRLGIDGPASVPIHREEVHRRICQEAKRKSNLAARKRRVA